MTPEARTARTLRRSILDGIFYSVMVGAGETYFTPWAIALGANNLVLGLLVAFPVLVGSLAQTFSLRLVALFGSRRRFVVAAVALQALTFVPLILLGRWDSPLRGLLVLAVVCVYWAFGLVGAPAWSSLMGDVVPEASRGKYFGKRSGFIQAATFLSMLAAGAVLTRLSPRDAPFLGFAVIFTAAALARLVSMAFIAGHHEPPMAHPPTSRSPVALLEALRQPNQRALVVYLSLMSLAVHLAAPFFAVFMLRSQSAHGLGFSYARFTAVVAVSVVAKFIFLPLWGLAADRFGSRKCLVLSAWLVVLLPVPWLFPPDNPTLHLVVLVGAQVWSGFAWAGQELCGFNFLLDSAPPAERARLVSAMNAANGALLFVGASLGAALVHFLPETVNPFYVVFIVSSSLRLLVAFSTTRRLREVRIVEHVSYRELLFRVVSIRPQVGALVRFFTLPRTEAGPKSGGD